MCILCSVEHMTADTDILSALDFCHINWSSFVGCVKSFFTQNSGRPKYEVQKQNANTVCVHKHYVKQYFCCFSVLSCIL